jgi:hypothetical protein
MERVANILWGDIYEARFGHKHRGAFCLTRDQLKSMLGTRRLHATTIRRFQATALEYGLVVVDQDDVFPCIEVRTLRPLRRPPNVLLRGFLRVLAHDEWDDDDELGGLEEDMEPEEDDGHGDGEDEGEDD